MPRISLNHRNQWPGIGKTYVTYSASYDQYVDKLGGGLGFAVAKDVAGAGNLNTTHISATYAYRLKVNKKLSINTGFEAAYRQLGIDWQNLTFGDMIDPVQGFIYPTNEDIVNYATPKDLLTLPQVLWALEMPIINLIITLVLQLIT